MSYFKYKPYVTSLHYKIQYRIDALLTCPSPKSDSGNKLFQNTLRLERGERGRNVWATFGTISGTQKQALQQPQQLKSFQNQTKTRCFTLPSDLPQLWIRERVSGNCVILCQAPVRRTATGGTRAVWDKHTAHSISRTQKGWENNRLSWPTPAVEDVSHDLMTHTDKQNGSEQKPRHGPLLQYHYVVSTFSTSIKYTIFQLNTPIKTISSR